MSLRLSPRFTMPMISSSKTFADQFASPSSPVFLKNAPGDLERLLDQFSVGHAGMNGSAIAVFLDRKAARHAHHSINYFFHAHHYKRLQRCLGTKVPKGS
jgi:hypothetical protein